MPGGLGFPSHLAHGDEGECADDRWDQRVEAGFFLYDLTTLQRLRDGTLGWFYPVYVSGKLAHLKPQAFWDSGDNAAATAAQLDTPTGVAVDTSGNVAIWEMNGTAILNQSNSFVANVGGTWSIQDPQGN